MRRTGGKGGEVGKRPVLKGTATGWLFDASALWKDLRELLNLVESWIFCFGSSWSSLVWFFPLNWKEEIILTRVSELLRTCHTAGGKQSPEQISSGQVQHGTKPEQQRWGHRRSGPQIPVRASSYKHKMAR